jgi:RNA polymerase sigma-70 factor (ECF subfamily)
MEKMKQPYHYTHEDTTLMSRIADNDGTAFAMLYNKYHHKIYNIVIRIVKNDDDAREIVQDTFLQLWRKAKLFDSTKGMVVGWLITIAHNMALNYLRSTRNKVITIKEGFDLEQLSELSNENTIEFKTSLDLSIETDTHNRVQDLLQKIPAVQREVIISAYYDGNSHREISATLGIPLGTVKTRMRLGVLKLRQLMNSAKPPTQTAMNKSAAHKYSHSAITKGMRLCH